MFIDVELNNVRIIRTFCEHEQSQNAWISWKFYYGNFACRRSQKCERINLPVIVQSSRKHSSRLLMTASVLWSSSGASKNGNIAAPIREYRITKAHRPGVENRIRSVKCRHRLVCITFAVSSLSTTISPSLVSICDILACCTKFTFAPDDFYRCHDNSHTFHRFTPQFHRCILWSNIVAVSACRNCFSAWQIFDVLLNEILPLPFTGDYLR